MTTQQQDKTNGYDHTQVDPSNHASAEDYAMALENHLEACRFRWQLDQGRERGAWQCAEADAAYQWQRAKIAVDAEERKTVEMKRDCWQFATGTFGTAFWFFVIYVWVFHFIPGIWGGIQNMGRDACLKDVAACSASAKAGEAKK